MPATIAVERLHVGRSRNRPVTGEACPPLTWTLSPGSSPQASYEIRIRRRGCPEWTSGEVSASDSLLVPWPGTPLGSREIADVAVRLRSDDGSLSEWSPETRIETALLQRSDWATDFVSPSVDAPAPAVGARRAFLLRAEFILPETGVAAVRLYSTAHGAYEVEVNGRRPGPELLAPGWTSFRHRIRFQTTDLDDLIVPGSNALGVWLADGWYRGRLGFNGGRWDNYGTDASLLAQLEIRHDDGRVEVLPLDWTSVAAPVTATGLYDGERYDARLEQPGWSRAGFDDSGWEPTTTLPFDSFSAQMESASVGPVVVTQTLAPVSTTRQADGRLRFDFGQNVAGRLRIRLAGPASSTVELHHAEVLEDGRLAVRPLRNAPSVDSFTFAGTGVEEWAPRFTYHGFRYAELAGWEGEADDVEVVAEVVHTEMERTGWFDSSHDLLNRLHENTVWGMRGNFVDLPTDCPQRDERLGWTGDIQVFAPAAAFLYDSAPLLRNWLRDVTAEQASSGAVPNFVPWIECGFPEAPAAAWGDAAVIVPWVIYERTGDAGVLHDQYDGMRAWVDLVDRRSTGTGLWSGDFQLGDWLDPTAPPEHPGDSRTDADLVATAYFARSADLLARAARVLGRLEDATHYEAVHARARSAFQREFTSASGRLVSDTASALSLALVFDLLDGEDRRARAGRRLVELVELGNHRIQTGFVGTPIICDALVLAGAVDTAYHLLLQEQFPSWLFPVTMGATTIWERWDSMLPDGSVNPGEMTSFNHYALGAVVDFLHRRVAGLAPAEPGYRSILVEPVPGGGLTRASARHLTPYGNAEVRWERHGRRLIVDVTVPPGSQAVVRLPAEGWATKTVGPGAHRFECAFAAAEEDPPRPIRIDPHSHDEVEELAG